MTISHKNFVLVYVQVVNNIHQRKPYIPLLTIAAHRGCKRVSRICTLHVNESIILKPNFGNIKSNELLLFLLYVFQDLTMIRTLTNYNA